MTISKAAAGFLAGACLAAGAGGAYVLTRPDTQALTAEHAALPQPVEQSEGIVTEAEEIPEVTEMAPPPAPLRPPASPRREAAPAPAAERRRVAVAQAAANAAPVPAPVEQAPRPTAPPALEPVVPPVIVDHQVSRAVEPPGPVYDELVLAEDSVIGLEIETTVTSENARVEDPVVARVTRDVKVGNRVAIPAGSRADGEVVVVDRGGRLKDRARLGIRFTSIVLADGTRVPIATETIYREGDAPSRESAAKIGGGAIGGAIIGGILGGGKGAAIGGAIGAGAGTGAVMAGGRNAATLPAGTPVTVRVEEPVTVTVER